MEIISTEEREHIGSLCTAAQNGKLRIEPPGEASKRPIGAKVTKLARKETMAVMPKVFSTDGEDGVDMEYATTFCEQTWILLKRRFIQQSRSKVRMARFIKARK